MRIIPKKTKVSTEFFHGVSIADILVGFVGILIMFFVFLSSLPGKWWIELVLLTIFAFLLVRIDEEPNYMFLLQLLTHCAHDRRYQKMEEKTGGKKPMKEMQAPLSKKEQRQKKKAIKAEDRFLKNRKIPQSEKEPVLARRKKEAQERYEKAQIAEQKLKRKDIRQMTKINQIKDGFIWYGGEYYGAVLEIPSVEFQFFSESRRANSIDNALGSVIRNVGAQYAANIVKIERPMVLDDHIRAEEEKIRALLSSYERGVFSEEELQARIEIIYDRIENLKNRNADEKVLIPFFYLVLFDSDRRQLDNQIQTAESSLQQGEMLPHRLDDQELAVFLRYTNAVDFDEREIYELEPKDYSTFILPKSLEIKMRTTEINSIITHNFRVLQYPLQVGDAWGARLFDIPGTKVVVKFSQMDRDKSIRAIDRSISELNSQLEHTGISSKVIELQTHIDTLSELLVMLQNNNENLMAVNIYVSAYDIASTRDNKLLVPQPPLSSLPVISGMKKEIKRVFSERGFRLTDMISQQFEGFVAGQVNGYDPFLKKARGMPSSSLAAVFPWIYANLHDKEGLNLGSSGGIPTFVDFFRRDSERVNSNMVIVGKSGGGKSYATKSILSHLAADDSKIFVLDPENEYAELARNMHGKYINVANASQGRINPFQIITSLEDDEASDGEQTSSFSAHLQFLEEFFRQILPDIEADALEYLNNLINRVYLRKNIDQYTNLKRLRPEDYPIFDDLYDCILEEFQRTQSDYLKKNLRVLMNYVAKFSTGGRNANMWNGPSTLSTVENFIVFNFQALLANRNNTIANAQMLLVLKYLDNEVIRNREYNMRYQAKRKIIIVIDEAHVFIDAKYPLALDFMFQLAKRIRKYNGMQIVITQNIKDFVGTEELARKSTAIINACQYSFIFSLAPNDMHDLCTLYEKAGGINESEQEEIISAPRGQAFMVTGPTSRAQTQIETPKSIEEMFTLTHYATHYFGGDEGQKAWEELLGESREIRSRYDLSREVVPKESNPFLPDFHENTVEIVELEEDEAAAGSAALQTENVSIITEELQQTQPSGDGNPFSPQALAQYGFEALVSEIRRTVRKEVESEMEELREHQPEAQAVSREIPERISAEREMQIQTIPEKDTGDWFTPTASADAADDWFGSSQELQNASEPDATQADDWFEPRQQESTEDWFTAEEAAEPQTDWFTAEETPKYHSLFGDLDLGLEQDTQEPENITDFTQWDSKENAEAEASEEIPEEERPLVFEVTLAQLLEMED